MEMGMAVPLPAIARPHTASGVVPQLVGQRSQERLGVCHDAHGSRLNPHLINFLLRDPSGKRVVGPSANQRRLQYETPRPGGPPGSGQCFLECHGMNHEPFGYGG